MNFQALTQSLQVGTGENRRTIAVKTRDGATPGLFWLGGFNSTMDGAKATALDQMGAGQNIAVTRFDYSGCGLSGGSFIDGTISRWLDEAEAVFTKIATGPQVLVGSSMGAWLALLLNQRLRNQGRTSIKALVLIAPAVDMTEQLMLANMSDADKADLDRNGQVLRPSEYGTSLTITKTLIDDGEKHLLLDNPIETGCPVHIIHGARDPEVPSDHAFKLMSHLLHDEVNFTLVPDGDHRLSRPEDLERIESIIQLAREG